MPVHGISKKKGEPFVYRCINRLDRDTTGLLIIARHLYSASLLSAMMARRKSTGNIWHLPRESSRKTESSLLNCQKRGFYHRRMVDFKHGEYACTHYPAGFPSQIQIRSTLWLP